MGQSGSGSGWLESDIKNRKVADIYDEILSLWLDVGEAINN